ncbi:ERF109 protein [Hibiscus syriacus]|uniref:ERF109 protein n=1 Tax=Hibiscus syriacus TaxID=106335 RepID=A0A6A3ARE3_HIBSY|nr:ERF109 protein [Hibiscus syriacus]
MDIKATQAIIAKCSESMWKLTYFTTVETWVLKITYYESWLGDEKGYFRGWPNQELKLYKCSHALFQAFHKPFLHVPMWVLHLQHRCTPYLGDSKEGFCSDDVSSCNYCYPDWISKHEEDYNWLVYSFFRIGSIVLALHDASDVFLEAAKIFKYSGRELCASVCFGLFAISWLVLRLIIFPFWVIKSSSIDLMEFLRPSDPYPKFLYYFLNTMLLMLLVFHVYWWVLICSMIIRQWQNRGKLGEDIRSDSEDEGD